MKYFEGIRNLEELKKEYRKLSFKFHPDCGGSNELMQQLNNEYDKLFEVLKNTHNEEAKQEGSKKKPVTEMSNEYRETIFKIINLEGLTIELCGSWIWLSGNTYKHKEEIKKAGFDWSKSKKMWYWHPSEEGSGFFRGKSTINQIRQKFGSEIISTDKIYALA